MKFAHVTLDVKDMEASLGFYQGVVGLELLRRFPAGPDTEIAFLGSGATEVELICNRLVSHTGAGLGAGISLGFVTGELEDTISRLREKGFQTDGAIVSPNPQTSFFFAKDPDGYNIQFVKG